MGMCAELIAVGPFCRAIAHLLDYPSELYAATRDGAIVSRRLFGILEGSTVSRLFAAHLGISDPWDFNQHKVDNKTIDFDGLREFGRQYESYSDEVELLEALVSAGFELHFRPEG